MKIVTYGSLEVREYPDRIALGVAAASFVTESLRGACAERGEARVIFSGGAPQGEFLAALVRRPIPWGKVTIFHLREFIGLRADHPRSFRHYLHTHLLDHIAEPRAVHLIHAENDSVHESARYGKLLAEKPIDVACLGLGEKGDLAFNHPAAADFDESQLVKIVELDAACRQQQVNEGSFTEAGAVPADALTLTIPALFGARAVSCLAVGDRNAPAVRGTLLGPIGAACPASILRQHPAAVLHLDPVSASLLSP